MISKLNHLAIRPKLVIAFLLTGILPLLMTGYYGATLANKALIEKAFQEMASIQSIRTTHIESEFRQRVQALKQLAKSAQMLTFSQGLIHYHDREVTSSSFIANAHKRLVQDNKDHLKRFADAFGCYDIKIIDRDYGRILFTLKNSDREGERLNQTTWAGTNLQLAYKTVLTTDQEAIIDFDPFEPDEGQETAFFAEPVIDADGRIVSIIVAQMRPDFIKHFMGARQGMGKTGESYLLHYDLLDKRFEFRSNLQTMGNGAYVVGSSLGRSLQYWQDALEKGYDGGSGFYTDSAGHKVLVAFNKLNLRGLNWYLVSKIDQYEVESTVRSILGKTLGLSVVLVALIGIGAYLLSRTISKPIIRAVEFSQEIAQGKFSTFIKIPQRDELGKLAGALNHMALRLRESEWLKKGKEGLDDTLREELTGKELARRFISFVCTHIDADLGALYVFEDGMLNLISTYAFSVRKGNFNQIKLGEGIVGQAAREQQILFFTDMDDEAPPINYGVGEKPAKTYMIVPLVFKEELMGVVLLGSQREFTELEKTYIKEIRENAAILMNTTNSRNTIHRLLEEAQSSHAALADKNKALEEQTRALRESESELQAQQEELRVVNEELEEQTTALKESQATLQEQQEELQVTNEELEEKAEALEKQKESIQAKNIELLEAQDAIQTKAKELEVASKYKSEFLANMSHELRTPLNSILILSQLLAGNRNANLSDKQIESANAIHSSGEDLLTLINEILDLSKVEAGKVELMPEELPMDTLIADLERIFRNLSEDKGTAFNIHVAPEVCDTLYTDPLRLQQVLRNLLTNAFKFTEKGEVSLTISRPSNVLCSDNGLTPETAVSMCVRDTGIGIPKEQQAVIFEAFQQADGSTSRKYGGTGLGLSISRELSKLLGGSIHLESREGEGSAFTIVIPERISGPAAEPAVQAKPPEKSPPSEKPVTEALAVKKSTEEPAPVCPEKRDKDFIPDDRKDLDKGGKSLLIIEDDSNSAKIMRDFAREKGFKTIIAEDGETGLHFADYYKPSAIILDIGLPGIDGWTVLDRLKKNPELRHIPVHFMSAADSSLDALRKGAVGFLTKPATVEKVEATFAKIEHIITRPVRRLLVVEDDAVQQQSIRELIGEGNVETVTAATGGRAYQFLTDQEFDCVILDLGLEDMSGFELLDKIRHNPACAGIPVIVYTGKELSEKEDEQLRQYADSIIIKGVRSPERLLEESALFLHRVESDLPKEKQNAKRLVHDKEAVLSEKTALLVDDDMRNVFALTSVLEDKNMNIIIARDGEEGVKKTQEHPEIDIILMDIMMPKMDGYEAMAEIRKTHQEIPIIALTAKAMKGDRNKCIEAGANDYLAKPVDTDRLISMLKVWLYS